MLSNHKVVDLTMEVSSETTPSPIYPKPTILPWTKINTHGFNSDVMILATHTGTHLDAPYHFINEGEKLHTIDPSNLIGNAVMLNLATLKARHRITRDDLQSAEAAIGNRIEKGEMVIVKTGWEKYNKEPQYLTEFPGLDKDASQFLVERGVSLVGIDAINVDHPDDHDFPTHKSLYSNGILTVKNLCNLDSISTPRFVFVALPLKLKDATGSPIRAIAMIGEE